MSSSLQNPEQRRRAGALHALPDNHAPFSVARAARSAVALDRLGRARPNTWAARLHVRGCKRNEFDGTGRIFAAVALVALLACLPSTHAGKPLNVVATITDFGAIAREVGGDKVKVTSIAKGTEDSHFVDARPSFMKVLNQADVLIEGGAELELGWLPPLVNGARNSKILADAPGHVVLGRHIRLSEVPSGPVDRSMGDVHPLGNPHFWLDPENGKIIARVLADAFSKLDPADASVFAANLKSFDERLDQKIPEWTRALAPYRGTKVVSYHKSLDYLFERFGFQLVGTIESRPGIEPSPAYINGLIQRLSGAGVKLVVIEPYRPRKTPEYVARSLHAKLVVIPEKTEGSAAVKDYIGLFDYDVAQLVDALKAAP